jgi:hypothetical protein
VLLMGALWRRRQGAALPFHLGVQSAAWGGVNLVIAWRAAAALSLRDHAGAVALDRFVWLNIGLDAGYALVGLTLIACGVWLARRPGLIGAGIGVVVQGGALAILDFVLANQVGALL